MYAWRGETADHLDDNVAPPEVFIKTCHSLAEGNDVLICCGPTGRARNLAANDRRLVIPAVPGTAPVGRYGLRGPHSGWTRINGDQGVKSGYLSVETHTARPRVVRLMLSDIPPTTTGEGEAHLRYCARFNDRDAALMHAHEFLKRRLLDPDTHLYRTTLEHAIAAIEVVRLKHRRVYLDPELSDASRSAIAQWIRCFRRNQRRRDRFFEYMGYAGIGLLLFNMFLFSFA